ncbi:MAG TPA: dihydroneopterin aldolase [Clostridiales bacterium]|nr:dihydroneopterin aldolase [Clostridiales bacterium]
MDKIVLKNMRFRSFSGVLSEEKAEGQNFVVTLTLELKEIPGCRTDKLSDTVDYGKVFAMTKEYVEHTSCDLIEYMAENIIIRIMRCFSLVERITCEIQKPTAPIDGDFDYMSVIIGRTRQELEPVL